MAYDDDLPSVHDMRKLSEDIFFEGTEFEPEEREPDFELAVGESCHAKPEWVAALKEGMAFKISIRRMDERTYWYLDTEGHQGTFDIPGMRFNPTCWEKDE